MLKNEQSCWKNQIWVNNRTWVVLYDFCPGRWYEKEKISMQFHRPVLHFLCIRRPMKIWKIILAELKNSQDRRRIGKYLQVKCVCKQRSKIWVLWHHFSGFIENWAQNSQDRHGFFRIYEPFATWKQHLFSGSPFWMDDPKKILLHGRLTKIIYAAIFTLLYDFNSPPRRENSTISPSASWGQGSIIFPSRAECGRSWL